jgi:Calcineurin-like phosphoesterase
MNSTKIAHVSDLHIERYDTDVSDSLRQLLQHEQPNLILMTGDFADQPWRIASGKRWLNELCRDCGVNPDTSLLVTPGNHDYGLYGNFGFKPITGHFFRRAYPGWKRQRIVFFSRRSLTIYKLDSNPTALRFARGHIARGQLRSIRREWDSFTAEIRRAIGQSFKIAILHHHPLPVPFHRDGHLESFLMLERADELIEFLAANDIRMVLHGHKHSAPHSLLSLGTCGGRDRTIEFIGAGTAIATRDYEARGHNVNIITIEPNGLHYVRQFFANPGDPFRELSSRHFSSAGIDIAYTRALALGHKAMTMRLDVEIDQEGDGLSELQYEGFVSTSNRPIDRLRLPNYEVDSGHLSPISLVADKTSDHITLQVVQETPRTLQFDVVFGGPVTERLPVDFCIRSYDLNVFCMNLNEHRRKHPDRLDGYDWVEKAIIHAVDLFTMQVRFPSVMVFRTTPRLEIVTNASPQVRDEALTSIFQPCFNYSALLRTAFVSIRNPPIGYGYRISWEHGSLGMPATTPSVERGKLRIFVSTLLKLRDGIFSGNFGDIERAATGETILRVLAGYASVIQERLAGETGSPSPLDPEKLDLTLMVCDDLDPALSPKLKIVAGTKLHWPHYRDFALEIGDGIAGRAYKSRVIRTFRDDDTFDDPKRHTYLTIPGIPRHTVLYCLPLIPDGNPDIIYGILNVGSFDRDQAEVLKLLEAQNLMAWLASTAQSFLLKRLMEAIFS